MDTLTELFNPEKPILRTHKGRYATEDQFKDDEPDRLKVENKQLKAEIKRLKFSLELEQRKQPAWKEIRRYYIIVEFMKSQAKEQYRTICDLKTIIHKLKKS